MKVFIQDQSGDHNVEHDFRGVKNLSVIVHRLQRDGGVYIDDGKGQRMFVPWHRIEFIREEK